MKIPIAEYIGINIYMIELLPPHPKPV